MKYFMGITKGKAWRARNMADEIIERDATKQYTMLQIFNINKEAM